MRAAGLWSFPAISTRTLRFGSMRRLTRSRRGCLIDLAGVSVLTSAGVVALLRERSFGRPALFCPDGSQAARILEIVQAQRLVPIYRDLGAALRGLGAAT